MTDRNPEPDPIPPEVQRRIAPNVIDQRQQQIDPAGQHRIDPDARPDRNTKQPGAPGTAGQPPASCGEQDVKA